MKLRREVTLQAKWLKKKRYFAVLLRSLSSIDDGDTQRSAVVLPFPFFFFLPVLRQFSFYSTRIYLVFTKLACSAADEA